MYNSELWYMDFYEKIYKSRKRAQDKKIEHDLISSIDTSFIEKINLKFCKYVLGISKKSVNISARAELGQYPLDLLIKIQSVKYMTRLLTMNINPLLHDAYILSQKLHENGIYTWYTYIETIKNENNLNANSLQPFNFQKDKDKLTRFLKESLQKIMIIYFLKKLTL